MLQIFTSSSHSLLRLPGLFEPSFTPICNCLYQSLVIHSLHYTSLKKFDVRAITLRQIDYHRHKRSLYFTSGDLELQFIICGR